MQVNNDIPKTLEDCKKRDPKAEQIIGLANTIESVGRIVMYVAIVVGAISAVIVLVAAESFIGALIIIGVIAFSVLLTYLTYKFFSYVLMGLAEIVQNTRENLNVSYFKMGANVAVEDNKTTDSLQEKIEVKQDLPKNENIEARVEQSLPKEEINDSDEIKQVTEYTAGNNLLCPYCGCEQPKDRIVCFRCGKQLIK